MPTYSPIHWVQNSASAAGSGTTASVTLNGVVPGNAIVILISTLDDTNLTDFDGVQVSDDQGNTWGFLVGAAVDGGAGIATNNQSLIYFSPGPLDSSPSPVVGGDTTITVTFATACEYAIEAAEAESEDAGTWDGLGDINIESVGTTTHTCGSGFGGVEGPSLVFCNGTIDSDSQSFSSTTVGTGWTAMSLPSAKVHWQYKEFPDQVGTGDDVHGPFSSSATRTSIGGMGFIFVTIDASCIWGYGWPPCCT